VVLFLKLAAFFATFSLCSTIIKKNFVPLPTHFSTKTNNRQYEKADITFPPDAAAVGGKCNGCRD
jgi:hypothetical protein